MITLADSSRERRWPHRKRTPSSWERNLHANMADDRALTSLTVLDYVEMRDEYLERVPIKSHLTVQNDNSTSVERKS